jgi:hypothetical protein
MSDVKVFENPEYRGTWLVTLDGIEVGFFSGPAAQSRAEAHADRVRAEFATGKAA